MKQYNLKDLANKLDISERTARRYIDELINETQTIRENKYKFSYLSLITVLIQDKILTLF